MREASLPMQSEDGRPLLLARPVACRLMGLIETEQAIRWVILSSIHIDDTSVISAHPESVSDVRELIGTQISLAAL